MTSNSDNLLNIKKLEEYKKNQTLVKLVEEVKSYAKEILILKEKTIILLKEFNISENESKRIIDYINSIVKLTETDREKIKDSVSIIIENKESEVIVTINENPSGAWLSAGTADILRAGTI